MGKYRKRFNEKAKSGMLAKQAALKKLRNKQFYRHLDDGTNQESESKSKPSEPIDDPNAEILKPMTEQEKQERKRKLQDDLYLMNEGESKLSKQKRKRLDKYIEHQLKREEKKELLEKLSNTKMDTENLASSKTLGKGKLTRKDEMIEALELERQGRADDHTREVLYESRQVKEWPEDNEEFESFRGDEKYFKDGVGEGDSEGDSESDFEKDEVKESSQLTFVDNRPAKFGGSGQGFGFGNLKKVEKKTPKRSYNWRIQLEREKRAKSKNEDELDFMSEEDEEEEGDDEEEEEEEEEGDDEEEEEEEDEENDDDEEEDSEDDDDEEEEEEEEEDSDDNEDIPRLIANKPKRSQKSQEFIKWAEEQVKKIEGREDYVLPELPQHLKDAYSKPRIREEDIDHSSDEEGYIPINKESQRKAFVVEVNRSDEVQNLRIQLPVFAEEHRIMEAIYHHDCVIICGETGSGKTTQVPQFLYEAGFGNLGNDTYPGMIGVTQPRRVAAVSMANRIKNELGDHGYRVGHQIRFDSNIKNEGSENGTALKFMTDGVLLREMMSDFLLTKYSSVVIDEAHERNVNTDILIGMLSRVLRLRRQYHTKDPQKYKPLKLIVMSATLRVSDFAENKSLFKTPPPILEVKARQYPVSVHFNKHTPFDYLDQVFKKACKIHQRLPPGGILIFLTGQSEIASTVKRLRKEFPFKTNNQEDDINDINVMTSSKTSGIEAEEVDLGIDKDFDEIDDFNDEDENEEEEEGFDETLESHQTPNDPLHVLPLYSLLPTDKQMKVFEQPPKGSRLCVVATNVAETSLTIPGIRYVIDSGRSKERKYNKDTDVQSFEVDWISKASADQRAGRAGRTGPGHCYRIFSSAVYENYFNQFSIPEILRMPVEATVLSMKNMGIDQIINFPFPTPPDRKDLIKAENSLKVLGALDTEHKKITELGKTMSYFPLSPRFSKILIVGNQKQCLPYVVAIVSALSVGDPFISETEVGFNNEDDNEQEEEGPSEELAQALGNLRKLRALFSTLSKTSDALRVLSAVCAYDHISEQDRSQFLGENFLRPKVMQEIVQLRKQITNIVKQNTKLSSIATSLESSNMKLDVPNGSQVAAIKQMIASGFIDQVAIRSDLIPNSDYMIPKNSRVINIPYNSLMPTTGFSTKKKVSFEDGEEEEEEEAETDGNVYIHPHSTLSTLADIPPDFLIYQSLNLSTNKKKGKQQKIRMRPLVDISGKQLSNIAKRTPLLTYSKPLGNKYAPKTISSSKRECYVIPRFGASIGSGGVGWDLPVVKVIQERRNGQWMTMD